MKFSKRVAAIGVATVALGGGGLVAAHAAVNYGPNDVAAAAVKSPEVSLVPRDHKAASRSQSMVTFTARVKVNKLPKSDRDAGRSTTRISAKDFSMKDARGNTIYPEVSSEAGQFPKTGRYKAGTLLKGKLHFIVTLKGDDTDRITWKNAASKSSRAWRVTKRIDPGPPVVSEVIVRSVEPAPKDAGKSLVKTTALACYQYQPSDSGGSDPETWGTSVRFSAADFTITDQQGRVVRPTSVESEKKPFPKNGKYRVGKCAEGELNFVVDLVENDLNWIDWNFRSDTTRTITRSTEIPAA